MWAIGVLRGRGGGHLGVVRIVGSYSIGLLDIDIIGIEGAVVHISYYVGGDMVWVCSAGVKVFDHKVCNSLHTGDEDAMVVDGPEDGGLSVVGGWCD